jgi:hypothetical protein
MQYKFRAAVFSVCLIALALATLAGFTSTAGASTSAQQVRFDVAPSITAYSDVVANATDAAVISAAAGDIEQVRFTMPNGLPKSLQHGKCMVAATDNKPGKGKACDHVKIGTPYTNSGICRSTGRFCKFTDYVKSGDSFFFDHGQWRKVKCGNSVWFKRPPPGPVLPASRVQVVKQFTWKWNVTVRASISATTASYAQCSSNVGSAYAYAYAAGFAFVNLTFTATAKTKAQAMQAVNGHITISDSDKETLKGKASDDAHLHFVTAAQVTCSGQPLPPPVTPPGAPSPPSPPVVPPPAPPKDGTQGPGAGTPGSPGGPGAGGSPGVTLCRDASGYPVPGTPDPTTGNCPGVTNGGGTTGGSTSPGPPPPPPAQCIDPVTNQSRPMQSGETKDQFGYCLRLVLYL